MFTKMFAILLAITAILGVEVYAATIIGVNFSNLQIAVTIMLAIFALPLGFFW